MGQHHVAPVRLRRQAACRIDRIHYGQRNVGDGLLARLGHFARHVGFCERNAATLTSTCGLSITESSRAAISSRTGQRFADDADFADIGIEDRAIGIHPVARIAGATVLTCGVVSSGWSQTVTISTSPTPMRYW